MSGKVTKIGDYFHVVVVWPDDHKEHWLLTSSDVTRLRERGEKHVLSRPRPTKWEHRLFRVGLFLRRIGEYLP